MDCPVCSGKTAYTRLSPHEGFVLYKYYRDSDVIEHYRRYELGCLRCEDCQGLSEPRIKMLVPNGLHGELSSQTLSEVLDSEGYSYQKCSCGGRLITDMAALGTAGKALQRFSDKSFMYSTVTFDACADCGRVSNVQEKPLR